MYKKNKFLDWKVYRDARELFSLVLGVVKKIPKEYRFELGSQIIRSSFSILLNIAEGSGKSSDKELNRYLEIALGSVYETVAAIDIFLYNDFISEKEYNILTEKLNDISSQLGGFKKKLAVS